MDPVRVGRQSDVEAVVHDEGNLRVAGKLPQLQRHPVKPAAGGFLVAQLNDVGSPRDGRFRDLKVGPAPAHLPSVMT